MAVGDALLDKLIEQFAKLNGVGRKSATRLAYQVLAMEKQEALDFSNAITNAHEKIRRCKVCQSFTEFEVCRICADDKRDVSIICVVESPRDVAAFEHTREYKGRYHILHGLISPMDGVGWSNLRLKSFFFALRGMMLKRLLWQPTQQWRAMQRRCILHAL